MKLINTDGMAFIGPGSEWFWTAVSGVVLAITFLAIYRQLSTQRSAGPYDQSAAWNRDWNDEHLSVSRLAFMLDVEARAVDSGLPSSFAETGDFFERLGYLVGQGHLRSADIWNDMRLAIGRWWALTEPYIQHERETSGNPSLYEWFGKLELEMRRLDRKMLGQELKFDASHEPLRQAIDGSIAQLRLHADAKNGIFPSRPGEPSPPIQAGGAKSQPDPSN